ncbi:MAG: alpha/beta hydrolase [Bacteroidota bacterium]
MIASSLYFIQEKLLFLPTQLAQDYEYQFDRNFEELFLKAEDGATINAIHFKSENPKGVILYFHGNAGDLSRWGKITEYFVDFQYDVVVMDYRTYGKSQGVLSEAVLYSDAQLCYDYISKSFSDQDIVLYGRSLGTGIATYLAANNSANQLILETPYYSIEDVAQYRFPFFSVKRLLKYKIPTYQYLKNVKCPVTIIHGTEDTVVPYGSGKKLMDLKMNNIKFVTVEGGHHNDLIHFEVYRNTIEKLLE